MMQEIVSTLKSVLRRATLALVCVVPLFFAPACTNYFHDLMGIERISGGIPEDPFITSFTVATPGEWKAAIQYIRTYGRGNKPTGPGWYTITIDSSAGGDIFVLNENRYDKNASAGAARYTFDGFQGTVTLDGSGTLSLESDPANAPNTDGNGAIIGAGPGQTIVLDGPSFKGKTGNNNGAVFFYDPSSPAVPVDGIIMNAGEISGNTGTSGLGGVYVDGGKFTMIGGAIRDNGGRGVYAAASGTLCTMSGGTIGPNNNGGVYIDNANFFMTDGAIENNTASGANVHGADGGYGGGVYIDGTPGSSTGILILNGGTITGNHAAISNGGVYKHAGCLYIYPPAANGTSGSIKNNTDDGVTSSNPNVNYESDPSGGSDLPGW